MKFLWRPDGRVSLNITSENQVEVKYQQLNPSTHFREVVELSRSVILAGGTMSPVSVLHPACAQSHGGRYPMLQANCFQKFLKKSCAYFLVDISFQHQAFRRWSSRKALEGEICLSRFNSEETITWYEFSVTE